MKREHLTAIWAWLLVAAPRSFAGEWPQWRGPSGQGLVLEGAYTDTWSPTLSRTALMVS